MSLRLQRSSWSSWKIFASRVVREFVHDLYFARRSAFRAGSFSAIAVLTLAFGIGSCTAVVSLADAIFLRGVPYKNSQQLAFLYSPNSKLNLPEESFGPSYADFFDLLRENHSFESMSLFQQVRLSMVARGGMAMMVGGASVDEHFFATLGNPPKVGRVFDSNDTVPGQNHVAVISEALWKDAFGQSARILSESLILNHVSYRIIGVMPRPFGFPHESDFPYSEPGIPATQVWIPLALTPQDRAYRENSGVYALARLKPGITLDRAQAEMSALMIPLDLLHPELRGWGARVKPFRESIFRSIKSFMFSLIGAVVCVLIIACANTATLSFIKIFDRKRELAVRLALGAGRSRLVRQLLTESLLLGLGGVLLGLGVGELLLQLGLKANPLDVPGIKEASLDWHVLLVGVVLAMVATLGFSLWPSLTGTEVNLSELGRNMAIRRGHAARNKMRSAVLVFEVALVVVLLVEAGLLLKSYARVESIQTGFSSSPVSVSIRLDPHYRKAEDRTAFWNTLLSRIEEDAAISDAAIVSSLPLSHTNNFTPFAIEGFPSAENQRVQSRLVTSGYFSTMDIPLRLGSSFRGKQSNDDDRKPIIVNEAFVRQHLQGRFPIGQHVRTGTSKEPWRVIVGVVGDVRHASLESEPAPTVYQPFMERPVQSAFIVVRSKAPTEEIASHLRQLLSGIDSNIALAQVRTLADLRAEATAQRRFQIRLLAAFGGICLIITAVGLYGLLSYSVRQRRAEIGIRVAVGSSRAGILALILKQGLGLVLVGLVIGFCGSLALSRLVGSALYGIQPSDPSTFGSVFVVMLVVGFTACGMPGWRAASVDPARTLREE